MPGKTKIRHFTSLHQKKYRFKHRQFLAEGKKIVLEILREAYPCNTILATGRWCEEYRGALREFKGEVIQCAEAELAKISHLETAQEVIAVCSWPEPKFQIPDAGQLSLYLDDLRDPGNMGTIIRLADWFGIKQLYTSAATVDWTNPKVIQSSMGSFMRVNILAVDPPEFFGKLPTGVLVMGADLDGESIYAPGQALNGLLVIGSESHGISQAIQPFLKKRLHIPTFSPGANGAESLNAAIAASLIIGELRRRQIHFQYNG